MVKLLIENGARLDVKDNFNRTPLECAIKFQRTNIAEEIIKNVSIEIINSPNRHGGTPLHQVRFH